MRRWRRVGGALALLLVFAGIVALLAVVTDHPRCCATVTMKMASDVPISGTYRFNTRYLAPSLEILPAAETLHPVIEKLDLVHEFSPPGKPRVVQEVYLQLKHSMLVKVDRERGIVWISVFDTEPTRAARIANTIAAVYETNHRDHILGILKVHLKQLDAEVERQRQVVEAAAEALARMRSSSGVDDPDPDHEVRILAGSADREALRQYRKAKDDYMSATKIRKSMKAAQAEARMSYLARCITIDQWAEVPAAPDTSLRWSLLEAVRRL